MTFAWIETTPARYHLDRGVLLVLAGLFYAAILAHRYWRAKIRLEDELASVKKDAAFSAGRYRAAFRRLDHPAALVDRASRCVVDATPAWLAAGLPKAGDRMDRAFPELEAALGSVPAPSEAAFGAPMDWTLQGRPYRAEAMPGDSLGLILVQPR